MQKLLIISGPTASGKTSLAFLLAKKFNGELVSADSRQVYREMDIVTGKELNESIKTWVVDVVNPNETFNVADYYDQAWSVTKDIWQRGKLPILVGGTGFYIKAVLDGIGTMGIVPDWELRRQLETLTVEDLGKQLEKLNPNRWKQMNKSDRKNPRRLIRAIEVSGKPEARSRKPPKASLAKGGKPGADVFWIGLTSTFPVLYQRIDQRVDQRLKMGAVWETKRLAETYGWDIPSMTGQGYRQLRQLVEGKISLEEVVKRWKFAEHLYCRKQMTWFKKEKRIVWFDITQKNLLKKVQDTVEQWYTNK